MAFKYAHLVTLLFAATTLLVVSESNKNFNKGTQNLDIFGFNLTAGRPSNNPKAVHSSKRIIVGGEKKWRFGFNYTDWAIKNGPFYLNDTLVFKFERPNIVTFPHNVYLLPSYSSFVNCDIKSGKKIAEVPQGEGEGFEFVLNKWQNYNFACGGLNGFNCKLGMMKFSFRPRPRWQV